MPPETKNISKIVVGRFVKSAHSKIVLFGVGVLILSLSAGTVLVAHHSTSDTKATDTAHTTSDSSASSSASTAGTPKASSTQKKDTAKTAATTPGATSAVSSKVSGSTPTSGGGSSGGGSSQSTGGACLAGTHVAGASDAAGSCWPGPNNTGVPAGTVLTTYSGPCTITAAGTVIDSKTVNCDLDIHAANVTIKNSKVNGLIFLDTDLSGSSSWSMTVQDTEVDAGAQQRAVISTGNMTVIRANLHGGITSGQCEETSVSCTIQDSWLHGQYIPDTANWHLGGFLSDGGGNMTLRHNTIVCDHAANSVGEGCTGDLNLIPNFAAISGALIDHNLFGANLGSSFCTYGGEKSTSPTPHSNNVVYKDNIFQRGTNNQCAAYGPVTNFDINQPGNQWINNRWTDGAVVDPAN